MPDPPPPPPPSPLLDTSCVSRQASQALVLQVETLGLELDQSRARHEAASRQMEAASRQMEHQHRLRVASLLEEHKARVRVS